MAELAILNPKAAGIDIGSREFFVDAGDNQVVKFPTYTEGCIALKDYLLNRGCTTVAMESTGVYWVILCAILQDAGIDVVLVNGRDVKNVPGRKSDVKDCQWIRQLHMYGLLRRSFMPPEEIRNLRSYLRLRQDNIRAQASQVHLMQKALTLMNIRLTEAISDIMGASGKAMIAAILNGERNPEVLVEYCHSSIVKSKRELVVKALQGSYREEHLFALSQAYGTWHYFQQLIDQCDAAIEKQLQVMTKDMDDMHDAGKRKPIRYNAPKVEDLPDHLLKLTNGRDPIGIPGITDYSFLQIISEVGTDLKAWPTEKHFVSWLKLAPMRNSSGKSSRRISAKRTNNASQVFRNIAQGILTSKHIALGSFARRIKAKRGSGVAIKAVARKIACYYYRTITQGHAFLERGIEEYERHLKERQLLFLERMARKLNLSLQPA